MNRLLAIAFAALALSGCTLADKINRPPNYDNPFYAKYLNTGSTLDAQISQTLAALRQNPNAPEPLCSGELGFRRWSSPSSSWSR